MAIEPRQTTMMQTYVMPSQPMQLQQMLQNPLILILALPFLPILLLAQLLSASQVQQPMIPRVIRREIVRDEHGRIISEEIMWM